MTGVQTCALPIFNDWTEDYTVDGQRQGQVFFFQLEMRHHNQAHDLDEDTAFRWLTYEHPDSLGLSQYPIAATRSYPYRSFQISLSVQTF